MEKKVLGVCFVVCVLGLICAVTGFLAETNRYQGGSPLTSSGCIYRRTPAYGLGIIAAMSLLVAQIILSAASKCKCCCCNGPHRSKSCWTCALICFVLSWIGTILAFPALLVAAIVNDSFTISFGQHNRYFRNIPSCPGIDAGFFAGATTLSLASLALGFFYYLIVSSKDKTGTYNRDGIAMGQPQYPGA